LFFVPQKLLQIDLNAESSHFLCAQAPARKKQKTLDNTREFDHTIVEAGDEEVAEDEDNDEFAEYFRGNTTPKIMITTSYSVHRDTLLFVEDLLDTIPDSHFYSRRQYHIKEIVQYANNNEFTDILVINENNLVASTYFTIVGICVSS
jgi:ribosome production factor 1